MVRNSGPVLRIGFPVLLRLQIFTVTGLAVLGCNVSTNYWAAWQTLVKTRLYRKHPVPDASHCLCLIYEGPASRYTEAEAADTGAGRSGVAIGRRCRWWPGGRRRVGSWQSSRGGAHAGVLLLQSSGAVASPAPDELDPDGERGVPA